MESSILAMSEWIPSTIPASTTLTTISTGHVTQLLESLASATLAIAEATQIGSIMHYSQVIRGAEASLTVIQNQQILATATNAVVQAQASQAIFNATLNLLELADEENLYGFDLSLAANGIFTALFGLLLIIHLGYMTWLKFWYFGICFASGCGLEFAGYLTRTLAHSDNTNVSYFLCQIITLTIAPAFIMAGVYYLLGKLIVVHGSHYSILKPVWYSYIFISCDFLSLVIQAVGGAMAAIASENYEDTTSGTNIMVAGIAFQVFSMSLFLYFWFDFLIRINFGVNPSVKPTFKRICKILNFGKSQRKWRIEKLEQYYNQDHRHLRDGKLFQYFPMAVTLATIFIYVRCIYRVVELAQGWVGYLITHEVFVMCLDALMVFLTSFIFVVIHPVAFLGQGEDLLLREKKIQEFSEDENQLAKERVESCESHTLK